jgi:hypothetical protein
MIITNFVFLLLASITASVFARPLIGSRTNYVLSRDLKNTMAMVTFHNSCNATAQRQLNKALADGFDLASTARDCECRPCSMKLIHTYANIVKKRYFAVWIQRYSL